MSFIPLVGVSGGAARAARRIHSLLPRYPHLTLFPQTLAGVKYSATKWIHVGSFNKLKGSNTPAGCQNDHAQCEEWAVYGECEKNPGYMMDTCRKACKACGKGSGLERKGAATS